MIACPQSCYGSLASLLCLVTGIEPGQFHYVEVLDVSAVRLEPIGRESSWNVDGELLENNHVTAQVHKGLLEVFARGVEM